MFVRAYCFVARSRSPLSLPRPSLSARWCRRPPVRSMEALSLTPPVALDPLLEHEYHVYAYAWECVGERILQGSRRPSLARSWQPAVTHVARSTLLRR